MFQSKEEDKDQELIQSSYTTDPGHHMGNYRNKRKHRTQESQESRFIEKLIYLKTVKTNSRFCEFGVSWLYNSYLIYVQLKVSMIRKYHNHTLQTNPRHRMEEPQNIDSNNISIRELKQSNKLSLPLQDVIITKLKWTQSSAYKNKDKHRTTCMYNLCKTATQKWTK